MNAMTQNNPGRPKLMSLLVVAVLAALAIGFFLFWKQQGKKPASNPKSTEKTQVNRNGELYLETELGSTILMPNNQFKVILYGSTGGQEIGGYDAVLNFDNDSLHFVSGESLLPALQFFSQARDDGSLSLTGVKELQSEQNVILDKTPLAELVFDVVLPGSGGIDLLFHAGDTDDSNLIILTTEDILGEVGNLELLFGNEVKITSGEVYSIPGGNIQVTVEPVATLPPVCNDCQTKVIINVNNGTESKDLEFILGGIAGFTGDAKRAHGYAFEVGAIERNSVTLRIASYEK